MAHVVEVVTEPTDPRPFIQPGDTDVHWQARCQEDGCGWEGAKQDSEHAAVQDAEAHESES